MKNSSINIDPEIMSGAPVFAGTRVTIKTLFDYLGRSRSLEDFLQDYDWVSKESAINVIELTKKIITDEKILRVIDENLVDENVNKRLKNFLNGLNLLSIRRINF